MTWIPVNKEVGMQAIAETSTVKNHPLGYEVDAYDSTLGGGVFVYLQGVASTVVGSWVTINMDAGTTTLLAADAIGPVGVAMSANVASQYGWYQRVGKASGQAAASFADNGRVYYASSGVVDDTVSDGNLVHNALGASTITDAGLADFEIDRPYTDDITTND